MSTSCITFLAFSIGWEILELVLPFEFAVETLDNKVGNMAANTMAFLVGLKWRQPADLQFCCSWAFDRTEQSFGIARHHRLI